MASKCFNKFLKLIFFFQSKISISHFGVMVSKKRQVLATSMAKRSASLVLGSNQKTILEVANCKWISQTFTFQNACECWMDGSLGVLDSSSKTNSISWTQTLATLFESIRTRWNNGQEDPDEVFFLMSPEVWQETIAAVVVSYWWIKSARDGATFLLDKGMVDENNKRQSPMNFVECFSSVDEQGHHPTSKFILLLGVQKWLGLTLSAFGTREAKLDCWRQT